MNNGSIAVSPYINFQGRAQEAMEFYHTVLGGTLHLYAVDEKGGRRPAKAGDRVAHGQLDTEGASITGSDGHPKYPPTVGDHMAVSLRVSNKDQATKIFNSLADGGTVKGPLSSAPWGGTAGWLTDKFGINWVVSVANR